MSRGVTWCTLAEAESELGLRQAEILKMVADELVRSEQKDNKIVRINIDDLKLIGRRAGLVLKEQIIVKRAQ